MEGPSPNAHSLSVTVARDGSESPPTEENEYSKVADDALACFIECIMEIATKRTEIILRRKLPRLFMK